MGYGIGRVPADVDAADESMAELMAIEYAPRPLGYAPTGTTEGRRGKPGDRCSVCGKPADWNSGAGALLCPRHWDEY